MQAVEGLAQGNVECSMNGFDCLHGDVKSELATVGEPRLQFLQAGMRLKK